MRRLLAWLKSLFSKSGPLAGPDDPDRFDIFKPHERMIYSYFDGKTQVSRDPIVLYRKITEVGQELAVDIKAAGSVLSSKVAASGHDSVVKKVKQIFGVTTYEEDGGLTELEIMALLDHFLTYADLVKKNLSPLSTSRTETSPSTPPSPAAESPTTNTQDSGSIKSGGSTSEPPSSQTVSE